MQLEFNFFIFLACKWDIVPLMDYNWTWIWKISSVLVCKIALWRRHHFWLRAVEVLSSFFFFCCAQGSIVAIAVQYGGHPKLAAWERQKSIKYSLNRRQFFIENLCVVMTWKSIFSNFVGVKSPKISDNHVHMHPPPILFRSWHRIGNYWFIPQITDFEPYDYWISVLEVGSSGIITSHWQMQILGLMNIIFNYLYLDVDILPDPGNRDIDFKPSTCWLTQSDCTHPLFHLKGSGNFVSDSETKSGM